MNELNDVIQALTGVDLKALQRNDSVTLDVPNNRIIIQSKRWDSQSFDITKKSMNGLLNKAEVKEPSRIAPGLIIAVEIISIVVTIIGIVTDLTRKCTTRKKTVTKRVTTTDPATGTTTTEEEIDETEWEECENLPDPTPVTPVPPVPECCPLCGEQLVPGKKHFCR